MEEPPEVKVTITEESDEQLAAVLAGVKAVFGVPARKAGDVLTESGEPAQFQVLLDVTTILASLTTMALGASALCARLFAALKKAVPDRPVVVFLIVKREGVKKSVRYRVGRGTPNEVIAGIPKDARREVKDDNGMRVWVDPEGWLTYDEYEASKRRKQHKPETL